MTTQSEKISYRGINQPYKNTKQASGENISYAHIKKIHKKKMKGDKKIISTGRGCVHDVRTKYNYSLCILHAPYFNATFDLSAQK